jgi:hypothetical protein
MTKQRRKDTTASAIQYVRNAPWYSPKRWVLKRRLNRVWEKEFGDAAAEGEQRIQDVLRRSR